MENIHLNLNLRERGEEEGKTEGEETDNDIDKIPINKKSEKYWGQRQNGWAGAVTNLHTKFQPNRTIFVEVIYLYKFLAGRLVESV